MPLILSGMTTIHQQYQHTLAPPTHLSTTNTSPARPPADRPSITLITCGHMPWSPGRSRGAPHAAPRSLPDRSSFPFYTVPAPITSPISPHPSSPAPQQLGSHIAHTHCFLLTISTAATFRLFVIKFPGNSSKFEKLHYQFNYVRTTTRSVSSRS